jgi:hypothetical protein
MPTRKKSAPKTRKAGRPNPPVLTPEDVGAALVETEGNISAVARRLGVARGSVQEIIDRRPALQRILADAREGLVDDAEGSLRADVRDRVPYAVCFTLKCLGKERGYRERDERERDTAAVDAFLGVLLRAAGGGPKAVEGGTG